MGYRAPRSRLLSLLVFIIIAGLPATSVAAQEEGEQGRFGMFTGCAPVQIFVTVSDPGGEVAVTRNALERMARSRLRAARVYSEDRGVGYLNIDVWIERYVAAVLTEYRKPLEDPISGLRGMAMTWKSYQWGTHGRRREALLTSVSETVDEFIDEYLRVNAEACDRE